MLSLLVTCALLVAKSYGYICGPADVMFVMSTNHTLSQAEFDSKINFIRQFANNMGNNNIRVGLIQEYQYADVEFQMDRYLNTTDIVGALPFVYFGHGGSMQGIGLQHINQFTFDGMGGRPNVQDVVIYLTTSDPLNATLAHLESGKIQKTGAIVMGLGVYPGQPKFDLLSVASGCHYIHQVNDFSTPNMGSLLEASLNLTCDAVNGVPPDGLGLYGECCELPTCCPKPLDIYYVFDSSNTVQSKEQFKSQLEWAKTVTDQLTIAASNGSRISAINYAEHVHPQFPLDQWKTNAMALAALDHIPQQLGPIDVTESLMFLNANTFGSPGPNEKVVVITATGPQADINAAAAAADKLKAQGYTVVTVGIGPQADLDELRLLASDPSKVLHYPSFDAMKADQENGLVLVCDELPATPVPDTPAPVTAAPTAAVCQTRVCQNGGSCYSTETIESCHCLPGFSGQNCEKRCTTKPTDIVFVLDASISEGQDNFRKQVHFVRDVVKSLKIGQNDVQVGLMTFSSNPHPEFQLNEYHTTNEVLHAVNATKYHWGRTQTGKALQYVRETMLSPSNGARLNAQDVVIVLTDGQSTNPPDTLAQAQLLRQTGALVMAIGIGKSVDMPELNAIASNPDEIFPIDNFDLLTTIQQQIVSSTCDDDAHTNAPTHAPTNAPTKAPTKAPTEAPTEAPTTIPTEPPTTLPTTIGTMVPTTSGDLLSTLGIEGCEKSDILFMVQHSPDVDMMDVDHQSDMIRNLVNGWSIGQVHVGVTLYQDSITEFIKLTDYKHDKNGLRDKLEWMYYNLGNPGYEDLNKVLDHAANVSFQQSNNHHANKVAVAIVGHMTDEAKINFLQSAKELQDQGVTLYVLAVDPTDTERVILQSRANYYLEYQDWVYLEAATPNRDFVPNCP